MMLQTLKEQYHIGNAAAMFLWDRHKQYGDKADEIKALFAKSGIRAAHCPSSIELENAAACFFDVMEDSAGKIVNACAALEKFYSHIILPSVDAVVNSLVDDVVLNKFLIDYAEAVALCKSDSHGDFVVKDTNLAEAPDDDSDDLYAGRETSTAHEDIDAANIVRGDSIQSAFDEYFTDYGDKIEELMSGFPSKLGRDVWSDIYGVLENKTADFASGYYSNGLEHRFLEALEKEIDAQYYDDLFVRLKKERKLDDVALQRVFLARFVAQHRIKCVHEMGEAVRDEWFFYNAASVKKESGGKKLMREKTNFLQQCFKSHRDWLDAFLKN
ncbi:hypothetical protein HY485_01965 [Candidatus Woesearchaeota archaeon]|nr:hypothetical protein [Candidatus Woesearchaeota archaeon]